MRAILLGLLLGVVLFLVGGIAIHGPPDPTLLGPASQHYCGCYTP
jgi:hypothetical protein